MVAIYRRAGSPFLYGRYYHPQTGWLTRASLGTSCPDEAIVRLHARIEAERSRGPSYRETADLLLSRVTPATFTIYAGKDRLWSPIVGHLFLQDITTAHVVGLIRHRRAVRARPNTVATDLSFLSSVLTLGGISREQNVVLQARCAEGVLRTRLGIDSSPAAF